MDKVISLNDFKIKKETNNPGVAITEAGSSFRKRFIKALLELETSFNDEIIKANTKADIKTKINISSILKKAKSSPLTAYSHTHRTFVESLVEETVKKCNAKLYAKFQEQQRPTIESLQKRLAEEKALYKAELSKLASQKMSEYLEEKSPLK